MTRPAPRIYSLTDRPDRLSWQAAGGFSIILLLALLPLNEFALWVNVNEFERWAYTEPLIALIVLGIAGTMLSKGATPVIPLCLIVAASLMVTIGSGYDLWNELHYVPGEDDYLSGIIVLTGFFFTAVLAAAGGVGSLLDRRRHP